MSEKKSNTKTNSTKTDPPKTEPASPPSSNIEPQKIPLIISKKNTEIAFLKQKINENMQYITSMESELFTLKKFYSDSSKLKRELDLSKEKNQELEKQIEELKKKIVEQHKEFTEGKRVEDKKHVMEINKLKVTIDSYIQKTFRSNMNELDNEKLYIQLGELKKENQDIIDKTKQQIIQKDIQNKLKFNKLKDRMLQNISETKDEVTELNMKYMDISTKLTLLQNHQLLVQLDYQTQQLEESTKKNEMYKKKIFDLMKDIELHKEVEISFAEKNKKLTKELMKYKEITISEGNAVPINNSKIRENSWNQASSNISILTNNSINNANKISDYSRILSLEKKVLNLEKKLELKKKEYIDLKEKNEHIENMLKNKDRKYSGLYNFLEESLNNFFNDENIKNNKDIYINSEMLKKFEFNELTKEQQYSTLIILMKYLIPLITNEKEVLKPYSGNLMEKYNIHYRMPKENTYLKINDKFRNFLNIRKRNKISSSSSGNVHKTNMIINNKEKASESLPSISRDFSNRKINNKSKTLSSGLSGQGSQSLINK